VGLGLVPDGGGTCHLPRLVGLGRALELTLLADAVDAGTAHAIGLVNRVVEADALEATAAELAARLAAAPRPAVERARALLRRGTRSTLDEALGGEAAAQLECAGSDAFAAALARSRRRGRRR
jgi:2-(1,2-epoxy-1,2-dihydrophenyl)acetyl-CoA isomerase